MPAFGPVGSFPLAALPAASGSGITVSGSIASLLRVGQAYSSTFSAGGGTAPYTWSASGLPTGLSINASTGVVSGTLTAAGSFTATVTATDAVSATGSTSPMSVLVIAVPAYNYDFPNPQPRRWASTVRTGWIWQTPTPLYAATYGHVDASKFLGYSALIAAPQAMAASKFLGYSALIAAPQAMAASKFVAYAVLQAKPYSWPGSWQSYPDRLPRPRRVPQDWVRGTPMAMFFPPDSGFVYLICG